MQVLPCEQNSACYRISRNKRTRLESDLPETRASPLLDPPMVIALEAEALATAVEDTSSELPVVEVATVAGAAVEASTVIGTIGIGGAVGPTMTMGPVEGPITALADATPIVSLIAVAFVDASAADDSSASLIVTPAFADVATAPFFVSARADGALSASGTELSEGATRVTGPAVAPLMSTESSDASFAGSAGSAEES